MRRRADPRTARAVLLGCWIVASSFGVAWAQENEDAPLPPGATKTVIDLRYTEVDLVYSSGKVAGASDTIGAKSNKLEGASTAVGGKVEDLAIKETQTEVRIALSGDILFDFDKATLRPEAGPVLERAAGVIHNYGKPMVRIEGHTDSKGSHDYNLKLSQKRANSVKDWLVSHGVIGGALMTKGFAETKPVAPNQNPDGSDNPGGRQKNRRVEIVIEKI